jgi:hypothetical protein
MNPNGTLFVGTYILRKVCGIRVRPMAVPGRWYHCREAGTAERGGVP